MPPQTPIASRSLNKAELGVHLSVSCSKTLKKVLEKNQLDAVAGSYPWRRIWRAVHKTEGSWLAGHLAQLKAQHPESPILGAIKDIEAELTVPLWTFGQLARALGQVPDTFSKALRQGRATLPIATLELGPRLRCYRPLEVCLWRDEGILLALPKPVLLVARTPEAAEDAGKTSGQDTAGTTAPEMKAAGRKAASPDPTQTVGVGAGAADGTSAEPVDHAKKAVFGGFNRRSRKNTA
jgi:hypothetical protein